MTEKEKENRIHSLALSFLGQQQITPNLYADQIIRGYKEGYHQAEKDLEMKEVDLEKEIDVWYQNEASKEFEGVFYDDIEKCAKHFYELGLKKGE